MARSVSAWLPASPWGTRSSGSMVESDSSRMKDSWRPEGAAVVHLGSFMRMPAPGGIGLRVGTVTYMPVSSDTTTEFTWKMVRPWRAAGSRPDKRKPLRCF